MAVTIKPFDEKRGHAISNVLIVFEFAAPLPPHAFTELRAGGKLHELLKEDLPRVVEQKQMMLNVNIGPDQQIFTPPVPTPGTIGGISFSRMRIDGEPAIAVNIETNALVIVCGEYERWEKVFNEVSKYLEILTPWLKQALVSSLLLQYTDTFKVGFGGESAGPLTALFNSESRYLPPGFVGINDAFHSHHGFFSRPEFELDGKLLTNVNVNVSEVASSFDVNVVTMHKYILSKMLDFITVESALNPVIKLAFQYLHDTSKSVFGNLLTDEAKKLINFESRSNA